MENLEPEGIDPGIEEVLEDVVDLEEYAKLGKRPPLSRGYRIGQRRALRAHERNRPAVRSSRSPDCCRRRTTPCASSSPERSPARSNSTNRSISVIPAWKNSRLCPATRRRAREPSPAFDLPPRTRSFSTIMACRGKRSWMAPLGADPRLSHSRRVQPSPRDCRDPN